MYTYNLHRTSGVLLTVVAVALQHGARGTRHLEGDASAETGSMCDGCANIGHGVGNVAENRTNRENQDQEDQIRRNEENQSPDH